MNKKVHWKYEHEGVLEDEDGSLTGEEPGSKIVPLSGIVNSPDCKVRVLDLFTSLRFTRIFLVVNDQKQVIRYLLS